MRREVGDAVVAPVVAQPEPLQVLLVGELVHRQQFDGGDAEAGQVVERRGVSEPRVGAAQLGRHAEAEAVLAKLKASQGDAAAYQYATIYAQWGKVGQALDRLETAMRLRAPSLVYLKTDALVDPLRKEPRFQAIERELKFLQ